MNAFPFFRALALAALLAHAAAAPAQSEAPRRSRSTGAEANAAEAEPSPAKRREEALQRAGIKIQHGPAVVPLGKAAELKLPADYQFIGPDSLDRFYELTQNVRSGKEVGVVMAPGWMLFFDYDDIGYVKDDDKDKLDADALLKTMSEGQEAANADRKRRGWDELKLQGWATPPHYDRQTNNLKWAINLSSSRDGFQEVWINESIRLLGRGGVMNVTIAADKATFKQAERETDRLLAQDFNYVAGQKYSEFQAGDKVAAYGLSALVLGGAGVMAAKAGLLGKFGAMLGKMWKGIVVFLIALGAVLKKFLNKITRAQPEDRSA